MGALVKELLMECWLLGRDYQNLKTLSSSTETRTPTTLTMTNNRGDYNGRGEEYFSFQKKNALIQY